MKQKYRYFLNRLKDTIRRYPIRDFNVDADTLVRMKNGHQSLGSIISLHDAEDDEGMEELSQFEANQICKGWGHEYKKAL